MRVFLGIFGLLGWFVVVAAVVSVISSKPSPPRDARPSPAEERLARFKAEQREQDNWVAKCMGPGAGDLRPKDYSAMLDACERDNAEYDPQVAAEVDQRIADARARVVDQQESDRAAARTESQPVDPGAR